MGKGGGLGGIRTVRVAITEHANAKNEPPNKIATANVAQDHWDCKQ